MSIPAKLCLLMLLSGIVLGDELPDDMVEGKVFLVLVRKLNRQCILLTNLFYQREKRFLLSIGHAGKESRKALQKSKPRIYWSFHFIIWHEISVLML